MCRFGDGVGDKYFGRWLCCSYGQNDVSLQAVVCDVLENVGFVN